MPLPPKVTVKVDKGKMNAGYDSIISIIFNIDCGEKAQRALPVCKANPSNYATTINN